MSRRYDYHRPRTIDESLALKAEHEGARFIAGGTDLLVQLKHGCPRPPALISLRSVAELQGIELDDRLSIGAATLLSDIERHEGIRERCPLLAEAARSVGSIQIRNVATLGGNLCNASPCANSAPPLVVLDGTLTIAGPGGRRQISIQDFFVGPGETLLGPDEILTGAELTPPPRAARSVFVKKGRVFVDLALVSIAVVLELTGDGDTCQAARVAAGAVAPTPLRLSRVEALLQGQRLTPDVVAGAVDLTREDISPISDVRASADYRRHLTGVLLERAIGTILDGRSDA